MNFTKKAHKTKIIRQGIFGLRDFYNLIKFICSEWINQEEEDNKNFLVISLGFYRNFGGYKECLQLMYQEIMTEFKDICDIDLRPPSVRFLIK